ncbi:Myosin-14, partial [Sesamum angolense]
MGFYVTAIEEVSWVLMPPKSKMTVSASIAVGSHVWLEDSEVSWIDGEVLEVKGKKIKVICTSGKT